MNAPAITNCAWAKFSSPDTWNISRKLTASSA
jgi:hypothetical protein